MGLARPQGTSCTRDSISKICKNFNLFLPKWVKSANVCGHELTLLLKVEKEDFLCKPLIFRDDPVRWGEEDFPPHLCGRTPSTNECNHNQNNLHANDGCSTLPAEMYFKSEVKQPYQNNLHATSMTRKNMLKMGKNTKHKNKETHKKSSLTSPTNGTQSK